MRKNIVVSRDLSLSFDFLLKSVTTKENSKLPLPKPFKYVSMGRGALFLVARALKLGHKDTVLLPAYLCPSIIEPFIRVGVRIRFYRVNENLVLDLDDVERQLTSDVKMMLYINYFGFPQPMEHVKRLKREVSCLVEDCAHSFLSQGGFQGDYVIYSIRKSLPMPDGAALVFRRRRVSQHFRQSKKNVFSYLYTSFQTLFLLCQHTKYKSFSHSILPIVRVFKIRSSKDSSPCWLSPRMLSCFNFKSIAEKRRQNYKYLLEELEELALFPKLTLGIVPFCFPIVIAKRDRVMRALLRAGIESSVFWPLPRLISKVKYPISWKISKRILALPVNQDLGEKEMAYMSQSLKKALKARNRSY